jgi:hypothetical protein
VHSTFSTRRDQYFQGDEGFRELQNELLQDPNKGPVIPGVGESVRKIRFSEPKRGKGKRGGGRAIYFYIPEVSIVVFLALYDKDEAEDLSPNQRKQLAQAAKTAREQILASFGKIR